MEDSSDPLGGGDDSRGGQVKRPLIGITIQQHPGTPEIKRGRPLFFLDAAYAERVREAGGVPVLLPPGAVELETLEMLDGLLLTGGEDVDPSYYGESPLPELGTVDTQRDIQELPLAKAAFQRGLPILAICRGMQLLNVAAGGTLYQDLAVQHDTRIRHLQQAPVEVSTHDVRLEKGSELTQLAQATILGVNTFHHQAVKDLAPGLMPVAWGEDGLIEAYERHEGWVLGLQWHPELQPGAVTMAFFRRFVEAAACFSDRLAPR